MDPSAIDAFADHDVNDPLSYHHDPATVQQTNAPPHSAIFFARQCRNRKGWRRVVVNFTPSWFAVTMGTGITSILLHNLPYNGAWLYWLSVVMFCLNIILFVGFAIINVLRYTIFRGIWKSMLKHPVQSLFLGTIPMGLATIINMIVFVCVPVFGDWAITLAWTLWWIDVVLSLATNLYLPFIIMSKHNHSQLDTMTATWLLPIVAPIVAAASGAIVAGVLPKPQHALWTLLVSYILWGCAVPLAMVVLTIYFHRLTMYHLPPREVIVSSFLPLGPLGQGAYAIMQLGTVALDIFSKTEIGPIVGSPVVGQIFYTVGLLIGILMWGYGIVWLFLALASISRSKFPFNLGWWGFTFPLGVYTVATIQLSKELPSLFFKVLGTVFAVVVIGLWIVVSVGTVKAIYTGRIFVAPCVKQWEAEQESEDAERIKEREKMTP